MEITNLTLAYQLLEIRPLIEGVFVNHVQEISKEVYKFRLHTKEGGKALVVNPSVLYLSQYKIAAKQNAYGFAAFLKKHLYNKRILSIEQHNFDRVVVMEFSDYFLIFEFFRNSNIILADREYKILNSLKRQEWKDRSIRKGATYIFPASRGQNPAEISAKQLAASFSTSSQDAIRALINAVNIAPVLAEEILYITGLEKGTKAKEVKEKDVKKIHSLLKKFYSKISLNNLKPVKAKGIILPFRLASPGEQEGITSLNDTLDDIYSKDFLESEAREESVVKEKGIAKLQYSLNQQLQAKEKFVQQAEENRQKAELIYKNFNGLQQLTDAINLAEGKNLSKKEIMYKLENAAKKGSSAAALLMEYNPKKKEILVELN